MNSLHQNYVDKFLQANWNNMRIRKNLLKLTKTSFWKEEDFIEDYIEEIKEFSKVPDAWRVVQENWGNRKVMVLECVEVTISHDLSMNKLISYENLWWAFDDSETMHLRVYKVNKDGIIYSIIDDEPVYFDNRGIENQNQSPRSIMPKSKALKIIGNTDEVDLTKSLVDTFDFEKQIA